MRKAPTETSGHMTRGHENEEPHARRFYVKYGASRDEQAFEALKAAQGKRAWMRYSPDDVVQMPVVLRPDANGVFRPSLNHGKPLRWLIDYKAPSRIEESDEIAFQYACQLTQGAILCAETGIDLDGMMLSQFDWANWQLKDDAVLWDQSLGELVLDAGDFYWQHVLSANVPSYIRTPELDGVDGLKSTYAAAAEMFANVSALAAAAKLRADEIRKVLLSPVEGTKLAGQKITFSMAGETMTMSGKRMLDREMAVKVFTEEQLLAVSSKTGYDADAMARVLRELNVDTKQFRTYELDSVKVYAKASELGFDADALVVEQITMAPAKAVKQQMVDFIDQNYPLSAAQVEREAHIVFQAGDQADQAGHMGVQQWQESVEQESADLAVEAHEGQLQTMSVS